MRQSGLPVLLLAVILLSVYPAPLVSEMSADSSVVMPQDSVRSHAGISMGIGVLVEGISITTHNAIPYFGAGHFLQKDWLNGALFLGTEVGLPVLEKSLRNKVGPSDWRRYPSLSGIDFYTKTYGLSAGSSAYKQYADLAHHSEFYVRLIDFYGAYRGYHARTAQLNKIQLGDESLPSLMLSPFKPKILANPWVFGPVILAGAVSYFEARSNKPLSSAREIDMFDSKISPTRALMTHGAIDAYRYMLVAAGEEMFFRGALQTELTERTDPTTALALSSLVFGAWHLPNNSVASSLAATAGGLYLGYRYQANGYDLSEVIATHFWIDFIMSVIEFIQNPRNGRFVYAITWKM